MEDFDQISKNFKDFAELQAYADAQYRAITKLNAEINQLKEKNTSLEKILKDQTPVELPVDLKKFTNAEDAEIIARTQLKILRDKSLQGELTLEESKRTQIFTDILDKLEAKKKKDEKDVTPLEEGELLKLVENAESGN